MSAQIESPRRDTDSRRAEIAAAVRTLIAERGFEGLRMRDIAERVGINIATLHYHIPSKEALITLVAQSLRDDFIAQHRAQPRENLSPLERLRLEFSDFRDTFFNNPERQLVMGEMQERARRDPAVAAAMTPMRGYWHQELCEILEAGRADGTFRADLDVSAAAAIVIGGMVASTKQPNPTAESLDRIFSEIERCVLKSSS